MTPEWKDKSKGQGAIFWNYDKHFLWHMFPILVVAIFTVRSFWRLQCHVDRCQIVQVCNDPEHLRLDEVASEGPGETESRQELVDVLEVVSNQSQFRSKTNHDTTDMLVLQFVNLPMGFIEECYWFKRPYNTQGWEGHPKWCSKHRLIILCLHCASKWGLVIWNNCFCMQSTEKPRPVTMPPWALYLMGDFAHLASARSGERDRQRHLNKYFDWFDWFHHIFLKDKGSPYITVL